MLFESKIVCCLSLVANVVLSSFLWSFKSKMDVQVARSASSSRHRERKHRPSMTTALNELCLNIQKEETDKNDEQGSSQLEELTECNNIQKEETDKIDEQGSSQLEELTELIDVEDTTTDSLEPKWKQALQLSINEILSSNRSLANVLIGFFYCFVSDVKKYRDQAKEYFKAADDLLAQDILLDDLVRYPMNEWGIKFSTNDELITFAFQHCHNPLVSYVISRFYCFEFLAHDIPSVNYNRMIFFIGRSFTRDFPYSLFTDSFIFDDTERYEMIVALANDGLDIAQFDLVKGLVEGRYGGGLSAEVREKMAYPYLLPAVRNGIREATDYIKIKADV